MRGKISLWWAAAERFFLGFIFFQMLKMMQIYQNVFFGGFSLFFAIFNFLKKFIKKMGQKLGNNSHHYAVKRD
jgi:hypothetical protein